MTNANKMAALPKTDAATTNADWDHNKRPGKKPKKIGAILRLFVRGLSLNRFDAERYYDHCLHSTVSTLQNAFGIKIERHTERVPCVRGTATASVKRYWINTDPDNMASARELLELWGFPA